MKKLKKLACALLALTLLVGIMPMSAQASGEKLIALTFDDGPSSANTARLLDGLKARGAECTFFLVGSSAETNPSLVKRMWQEGHQVASHTYSHPQMTKLTDAQIRSQLSRTDSILDSALGIDFDYMLRPPYGDYNSRVLAAADTPCFFWSMDTLDWKTSNPDTVYNNFMKYARDGSVALLHDTHSSSVTAALRAIDTLQAQGYEFVTLSEMFMRRGVTLENGKIYFDCYPKSGVATAAGIGEPIVSAAEDDNGMLVTISGGDSRGQIYYTTDGSLPTPNNSRVYTGPFYVAGSCTVTAQTVVSWNSIRSKAVGASVSYNPASAPTISIDNGTLSITCSTENAVIYYTDDGSAPTESSAKYTGAIPAVKGTDYRARAYAAGHSRSPVSTLTYSARGNTFTDVKTGAWYYTATDSLVSLGVLRGTAENTMSPALPVTREMIITMLHRIAGTPDGNGAAAGFSDVPAEGRWSRAALDWAVSEGILRGYGNNRLMPEANITRQELCAFVVRYMSRCGVDLDNLPDALSSFPDGGTVGASLRDELNAACALGIIRGCPDGTVKATAGASRAEAAVILERMNALIAAESPAEPDPVETPAPAEAPTHSATAVQQEA